MPIGLCETLVRCDWDCTRWNRCRRRPGGRRCRRGCGGRLWLRHLVGRRTCRDVDRPASRYPYSRDGVIAVPAQADWLDPMIALSFAAAASSRVDVATGVLLLPEHNPVIVAKEAASLDRLSGRRLTLGVASDGPRRSSTRSECHSSGAQSAPPNTSLQCAHYGATTSHRSTATVGS